MQDSIGAYYFSDGYSLIADGGDGSHINPYSSDTRDRFNTISSSSDDQDYDNTNMVDMSIYQSNITHQIRIATDK